MADRILFELRIAQLKNQFDDALWPQLITCEVTEQELEVAFTLPTSLAYFDGHFPSQAVLPGVVQVHWVGELSRLIFDLEGFIAMQNIKFINMALPEAQLKLQIVHRLEQQQVSFKYTHYDEDAPMIISSGTLKFSCDEQHLGREHG